MSWGGELRGQTHFCRTRWKEFLKFSVSWSVFFYISPKLLMFTVHIKIDIYVYIKIPVNQWGTKVVDPTKWTWLKAQVLPFLLYNRSTYWAAFFSEKKYLNIVRYLYLLVPNITVRTSWTFCSINMNSCPQLMVKALQSVVTEER